MVSKGKLLERDDDERLLIQAAQTRTVPFRRAVPKEISAGSMHTFLDASSVGRPPSDLTAEVFHQAPASLRSF
jgi:hypothetical protein